MSTQGVSLDDFLARTLNTNNNEFNKLEVQTQQLDDYERQKGLQQAARRVVRRQLDEYKMLTKLQNQAGNIITFVNSDAPEIDPTKEALRTTEDEEIDRIMRRANILAEPHQKRDAPVGSVRIFDGNSSVDEESSSDPLDGIDLNEVLLNQQQIQDQHIRLLQLKAKLLTNRNKLIHWAKIKSRKFRKIHNREQREKKMAQLQERLKQANAAGKVCQIDDYCQEVIAEGMGGVQTKTQQQESLDLIERQQEIVPLAHKDVSSVTSLQFMRNMLDREEKIAREIMEDEEGKPKLQQVQNYMGGSDTNKAHKSQYENNPFLDEEEEATPISKKQSQLIRRKALRIINENKHLFTQQVAQVPGAANDLTSDEEQDEQIDAMKDKQVSELLGPEQEVLQGWGSWAGEGISRQQKSRLSFRQEVLRQQRINERIRAKEERQDFGNQLVYISQQQQDKELAKRFSARNLGHVSQEDYVKYLKQAIVPQFQTLSNNRYMTQESVNIPRGIVLHQQREMERNVKELQKIQKQLEDQKIYIKGQKMDTQRRKAQF